VFAALCKRDMKKFNKIIVASNMFEEASKKFDAASSDMDFITSIQLSGAVVGIIAPLLEEQGGHPMHKILSRIGNVIADEGDEKQYPGMYRETYNTLKHAGNTRKKVKPSEDLEFETDLALEAARMLDVAKSDFKEIKVPQSIREQLSPLFIKLMESEREYA
jgi:hypothetical protein